MKEEIISKIKKVLQYEGFRFTKQREAVWNELVNSNDHYDADQIYENIKLKNESVSRATVYRTLDVLAKNKFIRKLDVGDGRIRYEAKISKDHHDHMICLDIGYSLLWCSLIKIVINLCGEKYKMLKNVFVLISMPSDFNIRCR